MVMFGLAASPSWQWTGPIDERGRTRRRLARRVRDGDGRVGLVQFFFGYDIARNIRIPGLQYNAQISESTCARTSTGLERQQSTQIEYGVVSAALIPLAYWRASRRRTKRA